MQRMKRLVAGAVLDEREAAEDFDPLDVPTAEDAERFTQLSVLFEKHAGRIFLHVGHVCGPDAVTAW